MRGTALLAGRRGASVVVIWTLAHGAHGTNGLSTGDPMDRDGNDARVWDRTRRTLTGMLEFVAALVREDSETRSALCFTFRRVHPDVSQQRFASLLHSRMCMHEREVDVDVVDGGGPLQCWACSRGDL